MAYIFGFLKSVSTHCLLPISTVYTYITYIHTYTAFFRFQMFVYNVSVKRGRVVNSSLRQLFHCMPAKSRCPNSIPIGIHVRGLVMPKFDHHWLSFEDVAIQQLKSFRGCLCICTLPREPNTFLTNGNLKRRIFLYT
jgi:hypothetical protein